MKHTPSPGTRFYFSTPPLPCPYLPDRLERRVVTELGGHDADRLHDVLSRAGFRRSHGVAYAPACSHCEACKAVRVLAAEFVPSRTQRKVWRANEDLTTNLLPPIATMEQFELFTRYQHSRHGDGEMAKMDFFDYRALIEDTPVRTFVAEFRPPNGPLLGTCLVDTLGDGLSAVYSIFEPGQPRRSLGTHMILWMIEEARQRGLPFAYLGYWIAECSKMSYKTRFKPAEVYLNDGWTSLPGAADADR